MMRWLSCTVLPFALLLTSCEDTALERTTETTAPSVAEPATDHTSNVMPSTVPPFADVTQASGLNFVHDPALSGEYYMPEIMGSGVGLLDYDQDGDLDVYVVQGAPLASNSTAAGNTSSNDQLFESLWVDTGELRFRNVTASAGITSVGYGMGVAVADVNADGFPDIYVTRYGQDRLWLNQGDGRFEDATKSARITAPYWGASAAFVDYDLDGDADLFVSNYVNFSASQNFPCTSEGGQRDYCGPLTYQATPDQLFENEGDGRFRDATIKAGLAVAYGAGLGVTISDFDGNGWPDLYVANDGSANQLWMNQGNGRFINDGLMSGTSLNADGVAEAGMGVMAGDVDNDGDDDLFMTHLVAESNTLYLNDGAGSFYDATSELKLSASSIAKTGFGAGWIDFDLDGHLDLFVANGNVKLETSRIGQSDYPYEQRNQLLWNQARSVMSASAGFIDISHTAPKVFEPLEVSRGAAFGDLNNDGAIDILLTNNNGPARVLLNQTNTTSWLGLSLRDVENHPIAGARIALFLTHPLTDKLIAIKRTAQSAGSYLSANDERVVFGLEGAGRVHAVEVTWPDGQRERWVSDLNSGQYNILTKGSGLTPDS